MAQLQERLIASISERFAALEETVSAQAHALAALRARAHDLEGQALAYEAEPSLFSNGDRLAWDLRRPLEEASVCDRHDAPAPVTAGHRLARVLWPDGTRAEDYEEITLELPVTESAVRTLDVPPRVRFWELLRAAGDFYAGQVCVADLEALRGAAGGDASLRRLAAAWDAVGAGRRVTWLDLLAACPGGAPAPAQVRFVGLDSGRAEGHARLLLDCPALRALRVSSSSSNSSSGSDESSSGSYMSTA